MPRRRDAVGEFNIWPAFTDALGGLVMVLVFLITVFVITEVLIGREIMGKDTAIGQLQRIIGQLEGLAGDAEKETARLRGRASTNCPPAPPARTVSPGDLPRKRTETGRIPPGKRPRYGQRSPRRPPTHT